MDMPFGFPKGIGGGNAVGGGNPVGGGIMDGIMEGKPVGAGKILGPLLKFMIGGSIVPGGERYEFGPRGGKPVPPAPGKRGGYRLPPPKAFGI